MQSIFSARLVLRSRVACLSALNWVRVPEITWSRITAVDECDRPSYVSRSVRTPKRNHGVLDVAGPCIVMRSVVLDYMRKR